MPRQARVLIPGAFYHVYGRGNRRQRTYLDDEDRRVFLERLRRVAANSGALVIAYCLMSNHFHLLIRPGPKGLPDLMHRLLCSYANWFNRRHAAVGHLYQGRYGSRPLQSVEDILIVLRYIHLNPVAARLVAGPDLWPWSSHAFHLAPRPPEDLAPGVALIRLALAGATSDCITRYRELMALDVPRDEEVFRHPVHTRAEVDLDSPLPATEPPTLSQLSAQIASQHGVASVDLMGPSKRRELALARRALARLAVHEFGHPASAVAALLGRTPQAVSRMLSTADPEVRRDARLDRRSRRRMLNVK